MEEEKNQKKLQAKKKPGMPEEGKNEEKLPLKTPIPTKEEEEKGARYLLFFVYNTQAPITRDDIFDIIDQLNKIPTPPEETRIDMVILSNGGFPLIT